MKYVRMILGVIFGALLIVGGIFGQASAEHDNFAGIHILGGICLAAIGVGLIAFSIIRFQKELKN